MESYLIENHKSDIVDMMNNGGESGDLAISVNLTHLYGANSELFIDVVNDIHRESVKWSSVLVDLQKQFAESNSELINSSWFIKENARIRFVKLPENNSHNRLFFPTNDDVGKFVQVKGTVLRTTEPKFLQCKTKFFCASCHNEIIVEGDYGKYYVVEPPKQCPNGCNGRPQTDENNIVNDHFITYQEIRIMESVSKKSTPSMIEVTLDDDLVESCQPGDNVIICGTVECRIMFGTKMDIKVVIRANSVHNNVKQTSISTEDSIYLLAEWNALVEEHGEIAARDIIVRSICPDVSGMYLVKLAAALAICSGSSSSITGSRNNSHLLLIGDPGLAKSRLLKFACDVSNRCSFTTGSGVSTAGLTAAAFQEDGEWQLEAGALPLADNGICCIDEFNMMSEPDKASLHEAMEQQTLHISKAGITCKLNTRCTIIAATNPKTIYAKPNHQRRTSDDLDIGMASSLLSRFDLILVMRDERNAEWDKKVAEHILYENEPDIGDQHLYDMVKLQTHFAAVRDINPNISAGAITILKAYYLACRADEKRNLGRTTIRLNDGLYRLAKAHAKLLFRSEVTDVDAVMIIILMESSFGFGRILKPLNILHQDLPLGPNDETMNDVMGRLHLQRGVTPVHDVYSINMQIANDESDGMQDHLNISNGEHNLDINNGDTMNPRIFNVRKRQYNRSMSNENIDIVPVHYSQVLGHGTCPTKTNAPTEINAHRWKRFRVDVTDEELDQLFNLDEIIPSTNVNEVIPTPTANTVAIATPSANTVAPANNVASANTVAPANNVASTNTVAPANTVASANTVD